MTAPEDPATANYVRRVLREPILDSHRCYLADRLEHALVSLAWRLCRRRHSPAAALPPTALCGPGRPAHRLRG